jgi:hypothetical protein
MLSDKKIKSTELSRNARQKRSTGSLAMAKRFRGVNILVAYVTRTYYSGTLFPSP